MYGAHCMGSYSPHNSYDRSFFLCNADFLRTGCGNYNFDDSHYNVDDIRFCWSIFECCKIHCLLYLPDHGYH